MLRTCAAVLAVAFLAAVLSAAPDAEKPALKVSIAIPSNNNQRAIILNRPDSHFHVVVTNVSDKPVRLWREWCSWGYFNLTFKVATPDGEEFTAKKGAMEWTKNYPDFQELAPGEDYVIDVYPQAGWTGFPLPANGKQMKLTLTAVYETKPDKDTEKSGVWTGRIESAPVDVTVYNWGLDIPPKKEK